MAGEARSVSGEERSIPGSQFNPYVEEIELISKFVEDENVFDQALVAESAGTCFMKSLIKGYVISKEGAELLSEFNAHLKKTTRNQILKIR